jgi:hypothetical protein
MFLEWIPESTEISIKLTGLLKSNWSQYQPIMAKNAKYSSKTFTFFAAVSRVHKLSDSDLKNLRSP